MLSNAYFLAKFRFDTAENEPGKNLQKICKNLQNLPILLTLTPNPKPTVSQSRKLEPTGWIGGRPATWRLPSEGCPPHVVFIPFWRQRASVGKISAKCCSFSAVSAPIFARKYAFCSILQNLPDSQADIFKI